MMDSQKSEKHLRLRWTKRKHSAEQAGDFQIQKRQMHKNKLVLKFLNMLRTGYLSISLRGCNAHKGVPVYQVHRFQANPQGKTPAIRTCTRWWVRQAWQSSLPQPQGRDSPHDLLLSHFQHPGSCAGHSPMGNPNPLRNRSSCPMESSHSAHHEGHLPSRC